MNKHFRKVHQLLKTKAKALGFSRSEIKSIAARIADNLNLDENASDEEIDSAIEDAVDDAMPFLQVSQSAAQRAIAKYKAEHDSNSNDEPDDDDDDGQEEPELNHKSPKGGKSKDTIDEDNPLYKMLKDISEKVDGMGNEITALKAGNVANSRKTKVQKLVKDTGTFGKRILREFDRMSFKDEDDFDEYLEGIKDDLETENKERKERGLDALGNPPAGGGNHTPAPKEKVLSDDEVKELAKG